MEKQLKDANSLLAKKEDDNELISLTNKSNDGEVLPPEKQETGNELLTQSNNTKDEGLIELNPKARAELERMKGLF